MHTRAKMSKLNDMNDMGEFNLARVLEHELATTDLIAPTIYRLAEGRSDWTEGCRAFETRFRRTKRGSERTGELIITWGLGEIALDYGYGTVRDDLRKLAKAKNEDQITELAAIGTAFCMMVVLMPGERITKVTAKGDRGDFFLNGRRDEMMEISGTVRDNLDSRFSRKKRQILLNKMLRKAIVNVSRFASATSRLERVK